jgi:hypothetical protein
MTTEEKPRTKRPGRYRKKSEKRALLAEHAIWLEQGQRFEADFSNAPIAKWYAARYGGRR